MEVPTNCVLEAAVRGPSIIYRVNELTVFVISQLAKWTNALVSGDLVPKVLGSQYRQFSRFHTHDGIKMLICVCGIMMQNRKASMTLNIFEDEEFFFRNDTNGVLGMILNKWSSNIYASDFIC